MKVELQEESGGFPFVAAVKKLSSVREAVCNAAARDEAGLVIGDEGRDEGLQPSGEDFGDGFDSGILQGNRPKVLRPTSAVFFWKEDQIGPVYTLNVGFVGMEGSEQGENIRADSSPELFEEKGTKAIRTRTGFRMHMSESVVDFLGIKLGIKVRKVQEAFRIHIRQIKVPGGVSGSAQQIQVKRMKNCSFLFMRMKLSPVMFNYLNFIPAVATVSTGVEVASIFITLNGSSDFTPLSPRQKLSMGHSRKNRHNDSPQVSLPPAKRPMLFDKVHEVDHHSTVRLLLVQVVLAFPPCLKGSPFILQFCGDNGSRITILRPTTPSGTGHTVEPAALGPVILEAEDLGFRDGGGDGDHKRDVIRSATSEGGQQSGWKHGIPGEVNKTTIEPLQGGVISAVGPSI